MPKQSLVLGCRVKPATLALLRAIAAREHRTLSRVAAELLERAAREHVAVIEGKITLDQLRDLLKPDEPAPGDD